LLGAPQFILLDKFFAFILNSSPSCFRVGSFQQHYFTQP
jgi:hypothetical protein